MAGFSVANLEEVREKIGPPFTAEGVIIELAHGPSMRFRVKDYDDNLYRGLVEGGIAATLHIVTGHFIVRD